MTCWSNRGRINEIMSICIKVGRILCLLHKNRFKVELPPMVCQQPYMCCHTTPYSHAPSNTSGHLPRSTLHLCLLFLSHPFDSPPVPSFSLPLAIFIRSSFSLLFLLELRFLISQSKETSGRTRRTRGQRSRLPCWREGEREGGEVGNPRRIATKMSLCKVNRILPLQRRSIHEESFDDSSMEFLSPLVLFVLLPVPFRPLGLPPRSPSVSLFSFFLSSSFFFYFNTAILTIALPRPRRMEIRVIPSSKS